MFEQIKVHKNNCLSSIIVATFLVAASQINAEETGEDWLAGGDEFNLDTTTTATPPDNINSSFIDLWLDSSSVRFKSNLLIGDEVDLLQSEFKYIFDGALTNDIYARVELSSTLIHSSDVLAESHKGSYIETAVNEAWLQYSFQSCNVKLGQQSLFWGNVEGAYAVDVVAPLDLTKPLLTDFADIRQTQLIVRSNCYNEFGQSEIFLNFLPKLSKLSHKNRDGFEDLEDELETEWGLRLQTKLRNTEMSVMYASLYHNNPALLLELPSYTQDFASERFYLLGASTVVNFSQLLLELDIAYKTKQFSAQLYPKNVYQTASHRTLYDDAFEAAVGFEYLTLSNHQINGGTWFFKQPGATLSDKRKWEKSISLSWAKDYWNDTLSFGLLANWLANSDTIISAVQAGYQWTDKVESTIALLHNNRTNNQNIAPYPGAETSIFLSVETQF